jgi:hypothetical protein
MLRCRVFFVSYFSFNHTFIGVSISKEVAKQFANGFLQSLGSTEYNKDPKVGGVIEYMLLQYGLEWNKEAKKNLEKSKAISSGALADISVPRVYPTATGYTLELGYPLNSAQAGYYDFVNKGVQGVGGGTKPKKASGVYKYKTAYPNKKMALSILLWLRKANLSVRNVPKATTGLERKRKKLAKMVGDAENKKKLAYAISTNIKKNGLRATYYIDKANKIIFDKNFQAGLAEALDAEVTIQIRSINGSSNK